MKGEWSRQTADNIKLRYELLLTCWVEMVEIFLDGAENISARWRQNRYRANQVLGGRAMTGNYFLFDFTTWMDKTLLLLFSLFS